MGQGLHDYTRRNGGNKMHIEFTAGVKRPKDPVEAAKLSSEVGFYTRSKMPIATNWAQYEKDKSFNHAIPEAINKVSVNPYYLSLFTNGLLNYFAIFNF